MTKNKNICVSIISGPNLNLLGQREPDIYGRTTLDDIKAACDDFIKSFGWQMTFMQSNSEGALIDAIHFAIKDSHAGIIINGGAYSHTSRAIPDALKAFQGPIIEVHLSNIYAREAFRHTSLISSCATGVICGFAGHGYILAVQALDIRLKNRALGADTALS